MSIAEFMQKRKKLIAVYAVICFVFLVFLAVRFMLPGSVRTGVLLLLILGMIALPVYRLKKKLFWETPAVLLALWMCISALINAKGAVADARADDLLKCAFALIVVFPLCSVFADTEKRIVLHLICWTAVTVFAAFFAVGLVAYLSRVSIRLPVIRGCFGVSPEGYLQILGRYHYACAFMAIACFFTVLYLFSAFKKWWARIPLALFGLLFAAVIILSTSRVGITALICSCTIGLFLWIRELTGKTSIALLCALDGMLLAVFLFLLSYSSVSRLTVWLGSVSAGSKAVVRSPFEHMSDLSGRIYLYKAVVPAFKTKPMALLTGFDQGECMDVINSLSGFREMPHMHNGLLQILMLCGIPGLLLGAWFYLSIIIECLRTVFAGKGLTLPERLLCLLPIALMVINMFDCVLLGDTILTDGLFCLFSGYLICACARSKDSI